MRPSLNLIPPPTFTWKRRWSRNTQDEVDSTLEHLDTGRRDEEGLCGADTTGEDNVAAGLDELALGEVPDNLWIEAVLACEFEVEVVEARVLGDPGGLEVFLKALRGLAVPFSWPGFEKRWRSFVLDWPFGR